MKNIICLIAVTMFISLVGLPMPVFAQQTSIKLFDAALTSDTGSVTSPAQAASFASTPLFLNFAPGDTAVISSTPDGTGPIVIDNFITINGANACQGANNNNCFGNFILNPGDPGVRGLPIETVLTPIQPIDVSTFIPVGTTTVMFNLLDFGEISGNTELFLVTTATVTGNVKAVVVDGDLIITGDDANNCIEINQDDRDVKVSGCEGTTINGNASSFENVSQKDDVQIDLGGGADKVTVVANDPALPDDLEIQTGPGDDVVTLLDVRVRDDLEISMGKGTDQVFIQSSPDSSEAKRSLFKDEVDIETGNEQDYVDIRDAVFEGEVDVETERGTDGVCVCSANFNARKRPEFDGGSGKSDVLVVESSFFSGNAIVVPGRLDDDFERFVNGCSAIGIVGGIKDCW